MRKPSTSRNGQPPEASSTQIRVRSVATRHESAIAHRIRTLRAEARAVYAEMSAAVLVTKREKK